MLRGVYVFFDLKHYTASDYASYIWGEILGAPLAEPLDEHGESVFDAVMQKRHLYFQRREGYLYGDCLTRDLSTPGTEYSTKVRLFSYGDSSQSSVADLRHFDYICVAAYSAYYHYIRWLRDALPATPILLFQEESIEEIQYSHSSLQADFLAALSGADAVVTVQEEMFSLARSLARQAIRLRFPMAPTFAPHSVAERKSGSICIGVGSWNHDFMNLLTAIAVFRRLRANRPWVTGEFFGVHHHQWDELEPFLSQQGITPIPWRQATDRREDYYDQLRRYDIILNLNARAAVGRACAEAALMGTPVVGNRAADMQSYCWPDLSVDTYDSAKAYELCSRLLDDDVYRRAQVDLAGERMEALKAHYGRYKERLLELVGRAGVGDASRSV